MAQEKGAKEVYHQPLLIKHGPLLDITGQKLSGEKDPNEKNPKIKR